MYRIKPFLLAGPCIIHVQAEVPIAPACAFSCESVVYQYGCTVGNYACICHSPTSDAILACIQSACVPSDQQEWTAWAENVCAPWGGFVTSGASSPTSTSARSAAASGASSAIATPSLVTVTQTPSTQIPSTQTPSGSAPVGTGFVVSNSGSPSTTAHPKKRVNPGVIAGPVVGGVAIIALAGFLLWKSKNRSTSNISHADVSTGGMEAVEASTGGATNVDGRLEFGAGVDDAAPNGQKRPAGVYEQEL